MKLLGNTKINLPKTENGKNMPYLQINEIVLVYFNLVNSVIKMIQKYYVHLLLTKRLVNC